MEPLSLFAQAATETGGVNYALIQTVVFCVGVIGWLLKIMILDRLKPPSDTAVAADLVALIRDMSLQIRSINDMIRDLHEWHAPFVDNDGRQVFRWYETEAGRGNEVLSYLKEMGSTQKHVLSRLDRMDEKIEALQAPQ